VSGAGEDGEGDVPRAPHASPPMDAAAPHHRHKLRGERRGEKRREAGTGRAGRGRLPSPWAERRG
jgi:hypothetical protein